MIIYLILTLYYRLFSLFEAQCEKGSLVVCSMDLMDLDANEQQAGTAVL